MSKIYRLYIDESGTHNYSTSEDMKQKYLSLTGIIVDNETYENEVQPRIVKLKKLFSTDPDDLPVLHREEIMAKRGAFAKLRDPDVEQEFNIQFLSLLSDVDFRVICHVLDKRNHFETYQKSAEHPYHYCLTSVLERYTHFLEPRGTGDVVAESRGKVEDKSLKQAYADFYDRGTQFRSPAYIQKHLTSKEIKLHPKSKGTIGLEMADLLAIPTKIDVLNTYEKITGGLRNNFNTKIIGIVQSKYCVGNSDPTTQGYGKRLF